MCHPNCLFPAHFSSCADFEMIQSMSEAMGLRMKMAIHIAIVSRRWKDFGGTVGGAGGNPGGKGGEGSGQGSAAT